MSDGTLDEFVTKIAIYRAKVAACAHEFTKRGPFSGDPGIGMGCALCDVGEVPWLRGALADERKRSAALAKALRTCRDSLAVASMYQALRDGITDAEQTKLDAIVQGAIATVDKLLGAPPGAPSATEAKRAMLGDEANAMCECTSSPEALAKQRET